MPRLKPLRVPDSKSFYSKEAGSSQPTASLGGGAAARDVTWGLTEETEVGLKGETPDTRTELTLPTKRVSKAGEHKPGHLRG